MKHRLIRRMTAMALAMVLAMSLAAPVHAAEGDAETPLTIEKSSGTNPLRVNETTELTLKAKWAGGKEPEAGVKYTWTYNKNSTVVGFGEEAAAAADEGPEKTFKVKGLKTGTEDITLTAEYGGEKKTATYKLEVMAVSLTITGSSFVSWTNTTTDKTFTVQLTGIMVENPKITWTVSLASPHPGMVVPTFSGAGAGDPVEKDGKVSTTVTGTTVTAGQQTAGEFIISAQYTTPDNKVVTSNEVRLTISGIVLSGTLLNAKEKTMDMVVNGSAALSADLYGDDIGDGISVDWDSSDPAIVSVMPDAGNLNAWMAGKADITATTSDGKYSAKCKVTVDEDKSVIAGPYTQYGGKSISVSNPLILSAVYPRLLEICEEKTKAMNGGDPLALQYITNLSVPTSQGTLYYNYSTEADTGDGVGTIDKFTNPSLASGSIRGIDKLYFVPKPGFSGIADITFTGIAEGNRNFSGIIRVSVGAGSGAHQISYRGQAGEPVRFAASDFDAYCQETNGRSYSYIIFNLPKASEGVLYYNYVAQSGNPVTTTTQFTPSGRYTLDDVCFVPNAAYQGTGVTISFRGVDTSGKAISGMVEVNVIQPSTENDSANVTISGERGKPVVLQNNLFNDACQEVLKDTLNFVTFTLPDPTEGALYINYRGDGDYDSRVAASTRCYYSGVPGLGTISFVPASNAAGRVAIPYTGHSVAGASFSGTLYISLGEVEERSTIRYSVAKNGTLTFSASDFTAASQHTVGSNLSFVVFTGVEPANGLSSSYGLGTLRHRTSNTSTPTVTTTTSSPSTTTAYFVSPTSSQRGLGKIFFTAKNTTGTVTIKYTAYSGTISSRQELFKGKVEIQVRSLSPEDIELSCKTGGQADLWAPDVINVCGAVMSGGLSYIEITSVPGVKEGRLYFGYDYRDYGSGTVVKPGDRFYGTGSFNISNLTFVPFARFSGEAEITYIGYSSDGQEQVSGRILVNVSRSADSHFSDVKGLLWAADSVEYLYRNGTVEGDGTSHFFPYGIVSKGDFTLMLVRAYGLTATGSVSFSDVPAKSYYADAIRIATLLNIVSGSNGKFNPTAPLTRQDAILMIYNTLKAKNKTPTNGLAADLSIYHDEGSIDAGAREAMGILVQMGVVEGDGGYLRPKRQLTRSEAAILLHTIMTL